MSTRLQSFRQKLVHSQSAIVDYLVEVETRLSLLEPKPAKREVSSKHAALPTKEQLALIGRSLSN